MLDDFLKSLLHFMIWLAIIAGIFTSCVIFGNGCSQPAGQNSVKFNPEIDVSFVENSNEIDNIRVSNNYGYYLNLNNVEEIQEYKIQLEFAISKLNELEEKMKTKKSKTIIHKKSEEL